MQRRFTIFAVLVFTYGICRTVEGGPIFETQSFNSEAAAMAAGWTGHRNTLDGNDFGFTNTDHTAGSSSAGEAGGTIARTENLAFYADTTLGGVLGLNQKISAAGEFDITKFAFNNAIRIGHFDASDFFGQPYDFLGFQVAEPEVDDDIRIIASIFFSEAPAFTQRALPIIITANGDYTWSYNWEPTINRLSVEFFNASGSVGTSTLDVTASERDRGLSLNAFGLSTGGIGEPIFPTNAADVFIDNVSYTVTPEPSSLLLFTLGGMGFVGASWLREARRPLSSGTGVSAARLVESQKENHEAVFRICAGGCLSWLCDFAS